MRLKLRFGKGDWLVGKTLASLTDISRAMQHNEVLLFVVSQASGETGRTKYQSFVNMGTVRRFEIVDQHKESSGSN